MMAEDKEIEVELKKNEKELRLIEELIEEKRKPIIDEIERLKRLQTKIYHQKLFQNARNQENKIKEILIKYSVKLLRFYYAEGMGRSVSFHEPIEVFDGNRENFPYKEVRKELDIILKGSMVFGKWDKQELLLISPIIKDGCIDNFI